MLQVVLVGAGSHSTTQHAPSLQRYAAEHPGRVRLAAVCDLDRARAERAAERFGFARAYSRVEELLAAEPVDAAVLVLPIPAILPMLGPFLERRIPIEIEKPMGTGIEQARSIAASVRAAGSPVMVSLNRRFDPGLRLGLEWARGQGPIRYARGTMLRSGRREPEFIWGTGIHLLDAMCYAVGPLTLAEGAERASRGAMRASRGAECEVRSAKPEEGTSDFALRTSHFAPREARPCVARLDGAGGVVAAAEILPSCGRVEECLRLVGDDYCVDVWTGSSHPWRVEGYRGGRRELFREAAPDEPGFVCSGAFHETAAFLDAALAGHLLPGPTPDEAMPATELAAKLQLL